MAAVVRPVAIVLGATFAIHRLAGRLDPAEGSGSDGSLRAFPGRLLDALRPDEAVLEAVGRTALLAGSALVVALLVGWLVTAARSRLGAGRPGRTERPISDRWSGLALAIAVPGLTWLPLHRLAVEQGAIPDQAAGPFGDDPSPLGSFVLWAVLLGASLAPTVAAARSGGRPWASIGSGGHVALGSIAARTSSGPVWRIGFPAITFGVSLALAEVAASTGGVIDRFIDAIEQARTDDLLGLATPAIVAGALLVPVADVGGAILRRVERPAYPGSDRVRPGLGPPLVAAGLVAAVGTAAIAGLVIGSDVDPGQAAFADPSLGGPWLGTDELGRSVAARTAAALGTTLVGSILPALAATVAGAGLAFFRRTQRPASQSTIDVLLDLVSWPAMLVVPLAAWPVAGTERSLLDPVVLQIIGLLLVPSATRLLVRPVRGAELVARLAATAAVVTGSALAIQLLAGFVVPLGADAQPGLGHLAASGLGDASSSPWPLTAALVAAIAAALALHAAVGALSRVGRTMPRATDGEGGWSEANPDGALLAENEEPEVDPTDLAPPRVTLADDRHAPVVAVDEPADWTVPEAPTPPQQPEPAATQPLTDEGSLDEWPDREWIEPDPLVLDELDAVEAPDAVDSGNAVDAVDLVDSVDEPIDIRDDVTVETVVDVPAPGIEDDERDGFSIEDEASQTVELRPSDLRQAGVRPQPD